MKTRTVNRQLSLSWFPIAVILIVISWALGANMTIEIALAIIFAPVLITIAFIILAFIVGLIFASIMWLSNR
jgi:ABC-type iron transport system FetAB permease component